MHPLRDGRTCTIVKVFYDLTSLEDKLTGLGFEVVVHQLDERFYFLAGRLGEGSTPRNRDHAALAKVGWLAACGSSGGTVGGGRPRRLGATQAGGGTW